MRLAVILTFALTLPVLTLPALAEVEPQCSATSGDGSPVAAMKKPGGKKALSHILSGTIVKSAEIKTVAGQEWHKIYPDSDMSRNDGYVKASEMTCEGRISTLWDQKNDPDYDDADPEFYCSWPVKPGQTGRVIGSFAYLDKSAANPSVDSFEIAAQPLPIRLWVDARYEFNGEDWLRGIYFDEDNTVGWIPASALVCN